MIATNIAVSGLNASVARLNASASNTANINTTGVTAQGAAAAVAAGQTPNSAYQPVMLYQSAVAGGGVSTRIGAAAPGTTTRYAPSSADADSDGMVAAPDVDPGAEAVEQIKALSAYRANLSVIRTADQMDGALLNMRA